MDHVKQKELEMLIKFDEVNGEVTQVDFDKIFPEETSSWRAILQGLQKEDYISYSFYSMQNNSTGTVNILTEKGRLRIIQLRQEKSGEDDAIILNKGVSGWTKWGAIGAWVAAGLTLIGIIVTIYLAYYPPKPSFTTRDNIFPPLQIDSNAVRTDTSKIKIVKDCCNAEDSLEPKPPEIKSKDSIK
jgi:hypothetical protein